MELRPPLLLEEQQWWAERGLTALILPLLSNELDYLTIIQPPSTEMVCPVI